MDFALLPLSQDAGSAVLVQAGAVCLSLCCQAPRSVPVGAAELAWAVAPGALTAQAPAETSAPLISLLCSTGP